MKPITKTILIEVSRIAMWILIWIILSSVGISIFNWKGWAIFGCILGLQILNNINERGA